MSSDFVQSVRASTVEYASFGALLENLLSTLLGQREIATVSVKHRVKKEDSATKKASVMGDDVKTVSAMHDFLGVRVITYFADQVDEVAELISSNFRIEDAHTKDMRATTDADRFGYLSMHLVIKLDDARRALPEWEQYKDMRAEVQIRSSLQHSWAEIEHDLGYKAASGAIPASFRRRFSRLAGLLELADDEFVALRDGLVDYEASVNSAVEAGQEVELTQASLFAFIRDNAVVRDMDQTIIEALDSSLASVTKAYAETRTRELLDCGYVSLGQVERSLRNKKAFLVELATAWLREPSPNWMPDENLDENGNYLEIAQGVSIFYLGLHEAAKASMDPPGEKDALSRRSMIHAIEFKRLHDRIYARYSFD